jgi:hypothetical protein
MRVLSISTLFPSPPRPAFGQFVARQMSAVADQGADVTVINPIGVPPWPLSGREPYRTLATCPAQSTLGPIAVLHPRFPLIPVIGGDSNPRRIARAILPLVRRLHAEQPFHVVDAQFFFPDGPAAAIIAKPGPAADHQGAGRTSIIGPPARVLWRKFGMQRGRPPDCSASRRR